jgi:hypothetical protein
MLGSRSFSWPSLLRLEKTHQSERIANLMQCFIVQLAGNVEIKGGETL